MGGGKNEGKRISSRRPHAPSRAVRGKVAGSRQLAGGSGLRDTQGAKRISLDLGLAEGILYQRIKPTFDQYVSYAFEDAGRTYVANQARSGQLNFIPERIGSWWDPNGEIDVVAISLGQDVQVIADALPEVVMSGTVLDISETYQEVRGDVTYTTRIKLEQADSRLRWGMTVLVAFRQPLICLYLELDISL